MQGFWCWGQTGALTSLIFWLWDGLGPVCDCPCSDGDSCVDTDDLLWFNIVLDLLSRGDVLGWIWLSGFICIVLVYEVIALFESPGTAKCLLPFEGAGTEFVIKPFLCSVSRDNLVLFFAGSLSSSMSSSISRSKLPLNSSDFNLSIFLADKSGFCDTWHDWVCIVMLASGFSLGERQAEQVVRGAELIKVHKAQVHVSCTCTGWSEDVTQPSKLFLVGSFLFKWKLCSFLVHQTQR